MTQAPLNFDGTAGPAYRRAHDADRLSDQHHRVKALMLDGRWRTIRAIAETTGDPEASVSAQLRHLRKERFGGFTVERRPSGDRSRGLFEYRVLSPDSVVRETVDGGSEVSAGRLPLLRELREREEGRP